MKMTILAITLLEFTGPSGGRVDINADEVSSIRDATKIGQGQHYADGTRCVLVLTNGHAVPVRETCDEVRLAIKGSGGPCVLVCGDSPKR